MSVYFKHRVFIGQYVSCPVLGFFFPNILSSYVSKCHVGFSRVFYFHTSEAYMFFGVFFFDFQVSSFHKSVGVFVFLKYHVSYVYLSSRFFLLFFFFVKCKSSYVSCFLKYGVITSDFSSSLVSSISGLVSFC